MYVCVCVCTPYHIVSIKYIAPVKTGNVLHYLLKPLNEVTCES